MYEEITGQERGRRDASDTASRMSPYAAKPFLGDVENVPHDAGTFESITVC